MRKAAVIGIILALSVNLIAYTGALEDGIKLLSFARKARALGNDVDEKDYLERAFRAFREADDDTSRILRIYTGHLLARDADTTEAAVALIKSKRDTYRDLVLALDMIEQKEKDLITTYLRSVEARIPFVDNMDLASKDLYPFLLEQPRVLFRLACAANVELRINDLRESSTSYPIGGEYQMLFSWKDSYLSNPDFSVALASSNGFSTEYLKKDYRIAVDMPEGLIFSGNDFSIRGKSFLPEIRTKYKGKLGIWGWASMTLGIAFIASGVGLAASENKYDRQDALGGFVTGAFFMALPIAFPKKSKRASSVRIPQNEAYNRNLRAEIEAKKKQIKVNFEGR